MAKLIMWNSMTLDGFVEGPNRDISGHSDVSGEELEQLPTAIQRRRRIAVRPCHLRTDGKLLAERDRRDRRVADFMNAMPKYVFSRTVQKSGWNNTQMFSADVAKTVARLKRDSAKDIFLFGSADLAASLIPHGLIDEFRIALNPIILGGGTPLFKPGEKSS